MAGLFRNEPLAVLAASCASLTFVAPVQAQDVHAFAIPAGRLSDALLILAEQADVSIAIDDPRLSAIKTSGLRGRLTTRAALQRILSGTGFGFTLQSDATVRIYRQREVPRRGAASEGKSGVAPREATDPEIVVTATKQRVGLSDYPASISVVGLDETDGARGGALGTGYILRRLPGLASTNLGPGRNKIFIRGIADSSFNGTSQATISQYLGEARLIYSAPDPNLLLYDVERVEVLEGPQGTLYGAGTLGGIIRLVPRAPDFAATSLAGSAGLRLTRDGGTGFDAALVGNLPLVADKAAMRLVAYQLTEGGYIDDELRDLDNVNRNRIAGVRASLRWQPSSDWILDVSGVLQDLASRDGQYAETDVGRRERKSAIAQPFDNDYRLATVTLRHTAGPVEWVSASAYTFQSIDSIFDATDVPGQSAPREYGEDTTIKLLSHETRASGAFGGSGRWLAGFSLVHNIDRTDRRLGAAGSAAMIAQVANTTLDTAGFGEVTLPLFSHVDATVGGRISYVRQTSEFRAQTGGDAPEPNRSQLRALPTAALSWNPSSDMLFYARYQEGYRPGALQIAGTESEPVALRFDRDHIRTVELGWRFGTRPGAPLSGGIAASAAEWSDVQADLVDEQGLPYIANIGSGRVRNVAANITWKPFASTRLDASGFLASSSLSKPAPDFAGAQDRDLPNIADEGWRVAARHEADLGVATMTLDAALRYVGSSKLAIRPPYDLPQGRYYDLTAGVRLARGAIGLSLDLDNLLDSKTNTFAFGNPFSVARGVQSTPLRPRSLRLGVDMVF